MKQIAALSLLLIMSTDAYAATYRCFLIGDSRPQGELLDLCRVDDMLTSTSMCEGGGEPVPGLLERLIANETPKLLSGTWGDPKHGTWSIDLINGAYQHEITGSETAHGTCAIFED